MKKLLFLSALLISILTSCSKGSACLKVVTKQKVVINDSITKYRVQLINGATYNVTSKEFDSIVVGDTYCR